MMLITQWLNNLSMLPIKTRMNPIEQYLGEYECIYLTNHCDVIGALLISRSSDNYSLLFKLRIHHHLNHGYYNFKASGNSIEVQDNHSILYSNPPMNIPIRTRVSLDFKQEPLYSNEIKEEPPEEDWFIANDDSDSLE